MTHTPGPWRVGKITNKNAFAFEIFAGPPSLDSGIATCWHSGRNAGEREANARLIAAAPELLEAAKDFLFWHDEDPLGSGYTSRDVHLHGLRAAIMKATGEP